MRYSCIIMAALAAGLTACGGGSGSVPNAAPQVTGLADTAFGQDTTSPPIAFALADDRTPTDELEVRVESSDPALLPPEGLVLSGSGANRSLTITPAADATGVATVTVTVRDPDGMVTRRSARVSVDAVLLAFTGLVDEAFARAENDTVRPLAGFSVTQDADDDPAAFDALLD